MHARHINSKCEQRFTFTGGAPLEIHESRAEGAEPEASRAEPQPERTEPEVKGAEPQPTTTQHPTGRAVAKIGREILRHYTNDI